MLAEKIQELQTNEEFMEKLGKVHDVKGYVELFAEYGAEISEKEAEDIYKNVTDAKAEMQSGDTAELTEEALEEVSGGAFLTGTIMICGLAVPKIIAASVAAMVAAGVTIHVIKKKIKQLCG